jgi:RHS repeat-associated protein
LYDADTGLVHFGAREYDASIGRWITKDPLLFDGGQANLYVYLDNDPINKRDPSGLKECKDYCDLGFGVGLRGCIGGCTRLVNPVAIAACMGACGAAVYGGTKYCEKRCEDEEKDDARACR